MTANGSHDKIVKPEDLLSYQAEPPLDIFPVAETQPMPSNAIKSDIVLDTQNINFIEELAMEVSENE